jgi:hypothetical protein
VKWEVTVYIIDTHVVTIEAEDEQEARSLAYDDEVAAEVAGTNKYVEMSARRAS